MTPQILGLGLLFWGLMILICLALVRGNGSDENSDE